MFATDSTMSPQFFGRLESRCLNGGQSGLSSESEKKLFRKMSTESKRAEHQWDRIGRLCRPTRRQKYKALWVYGYAIRTDEPQQGETQTSSYVNHQPNHPPRSATSRPVHILGMADY